MDFTKFMPKQLNKMDKQVLISIIGYLPGGYKELAIIPQTLLVDEHHVHMYAARNNDGTIARVD